MYKTFRKIINVVIRMFNDENDPLKHCEVYKQIHCSHIDGYLCNMKTCSILKDFKERK